MPHDQFAKCVCGHPASLHAVDDPWPCRSIVCDCESFATQSDMDKLNAIIDEPKR